MGKWVRGDVKHYLEKPENVDWGYLIRFGQPESIF